MAVNGDYRKQGVPVIDLTELDDVLSEKIAQACSTFGFFQVKNHDIGIDQLHAFRTQMEQYFALPHETKLAWKRDERNARGFFDDELTKQRRDWKEAADFGSPGSKNWDLPDAAPENGCLDGYNRFPTLEQLPEFRPTIVNYFEMCSKLSHRLAILMAKGLGVDSSTFLEDLKSNHTSYLRMNYYPTYHSSAEAPSPPEEPLGISPHRDAGFLTVLLQDDDCHSLQVWLEHTKEWITVSPLPGALTINTGDMAMIWSNGKYRAPLHRVLTAPDVRYSAPFFYNPGYHCLIEPLAKNEEDIKYEPCLWGYFRAVRFAGDLTDLGVEIQTSDYEKGSASTHIEKQKILSEQVDFSQPFSVEKYRPLLQDP